MVGVSQGESSGPRELVVRLPPSGAGEGGRPLYQSCNINIAMHCTVCT